jgi:hypothetical protein
MLNQVAQENLRINANPEAKSAITKQQEIAYGWKQGFDPIRDMINRSYSAGFQIYDYYRVDGISVIKEETFYSNRSP